MVERVLEQAAGDLALELDPDPNQSQPWPEAVRTVATRFRDVLLAHPGVLGAVATLRVNSPGAVRILEAGLAVMTSQGVPLALAMDTLNSVMMFVVGHTLAEAGKTPGHEGTEPGPPAPTGGVPELCRGRADRAGLDFAVRFHRTLDILIDGRAAAARQHPPGRPSAPGRPGRPRAAPLRLKLAPVQAGRDLAPARLLQVGGQLVAGPERGDLELSPPLDDGEPLLILGVGQVANVRPPDPRPAWPGSCPPARTCARTAR